MRTDERHPVLTSDGDTETNEAGSTSTPTLPPVTDADGRRYDFWSLDVLDAITDSDPRVSFEAQAEMGRRWDVAHEVWIEAYEQEFDIAIELAERTRRSYSYDTVPSRGYLDDDGEFWVTDEDYPGDPGGIWGEALHDRMKGWEVPEMGIPLNDWESPEWFLQMHLMIAAARRWFDLTGAPYELPAVLRGPRIPAPPAHHKEAIWEAWLSEERIHDLDGHESEPSPFCSDCTPHPALGFRYVEVQSMPDLKALTAKNEQRAEQIEHDATAGVVSLDDLLAMAAEPVRLRAGLVPEKGVTILAGRRSTLKTFTGLHVALSVLTDDPDASILFVAGEGVQGIGARIAAGAQFLGLTRGRVNRGLMIATSVPDLFMRDPAYEEILRRVKDERPAMIVLDHLALVSGDAVQDRADHMSKVGRSLADLVKASGGAVLVLAHLGKGDTSRGVRGSSAIEDQADAILVTERRGQTLRLRTTKMRDATDGAVKQFRAVEHLSSLVLEPVAVDATPEPDEPNEEADEADDSPEVDPVARQVFDILKASSKPMTTGQIRAAIEAAEGQAPHSATIRRHVGVLRDSGLVIVPEGATSAIYVLAEGVR